MSKICRRSGRSAGVSGLTGFLILLQPEILKSGMRISNTSGIHGATMGEVVLEMMLMFVKDAPACQQMKQERQWRRYKPKLLRGQTAGILGLGAVGREIARLCKAFGMNVSGIRR